LEENKIQEELLYYQEILSENIPQIKVVSIGSIDKKHDKTFKIILSDIKEMSKFLSQYIGLEVREEELEKYKSSFITKGYKNKESDIIYKHKNKEIYYLIEHQSNKDKTMPNRILSYCEEIIEEVRKSRKQKNPIIVPIVIYTGNTNWKIATNFSETQEIDENYKKYKISIEYELIDINKYTKQELIKKDTKLADMLLIEKLETSQEIKNQLIEMITKREDQERLEWYKEIVIYILADVLTTEDIEDIFKIIEEKEKNKMDEEWIERIKRNNKKLEEKLINQGKEAGLAEGRIEGLAKGKLENLISMIKNMLSYNETDEKIMKYTKVDEKQLEKIKKEIQMQN